MDQIIDPRNLRTAAPVAAVAGAAIVALLIAVLPQWRLDALVFASGAGEFVSAARPPLGATARSALALIAGLVVAVPIFAALTLAARLARGSAASGSEQDVPVLRRADAHPDAPARRPLRASEDLGETWGTPLAIGPIASPAIVPEEGIGDTVSARTLPADLDTPLAAVDPTAIPAVPRQPVRAVAPLARIAPVEADERIETFELTPIRRASAVKPTPASQPTAPNSLGVLLDRLEQGAARRGRPTPSLDDTLGMLRGLATR